MKIIHTEASLGWGGQEIRILSEAAGMIERGHEALVLCSPDSRIFIEGPKRGVPTIALPIGRKRLGGLFAMRRWLTHNHVDVINTHSSTDSWLSAIACATLTDPPAIVRTRHISAPVPNNRTTRWLYLNATQHIATTGEKLRQTLINNNHYPAQQLSSVPTGIDTSYFVPPTAAEKAAARVALGLPDKHLLIGIVATLRSWKGHRYLLEAFARLALPDAQLVIVGGGPQAEALQQQLAALNLAGQVALPGDQTDVRPWLQAMDIFVLPSYANEGVPQSLMQAMCCSLPCVTTDVGSISELALPDETALLVKTHDAQDLATALARLAVDPALRQRLGTAARTHCAARFGREAMLDSMESIFRNAIASKKPR